MLAEYAEYYNQRRPHQGPDQRRPVGAEWDQVYGDACRREVLGGIIHDYHRTAA